MKIVIKLSILAVVVFFGCNSGFYKIIENKTNSYYHIKNRFIDESVPDSIAIIEGNVSVIVIISKDDSIYRYPMYNCAGQVYSEFKYGTDYFEGEKYYLKLPLKKTRLFFQDFCSQNGIYSTKPFKLHKQERIILDVMIYDERQDMNNIINRDEPILMREMK